MTQEDLVRFFTEKVTHPCPGCGETSFYLSDPKMRIQLVLDQGDGSFSIPFPHIPTISRTCGNCGNTTLHDANIVERWIAEHSKSGQTE